MRKKREPTRHFMQESDALRRRIAELEAAEAEHEQVKVELERRAILTELTNAVALHTSSKLEPKELFSTIVTAITGALGYYSVALLQLDETSGQLTLQAVAGHLAEVVPEDLQIALGEGMVGRAAEVGESQVSGDIRQHPYYVLKVDSSAKSELAVPIKRGKKVVGVLDIQSDAFDAFDEVIVAAMESLSAQIAVSVENALLYEEARSRAERLAVVNRIAKAVGASRQLEELMEVIYQEIASVFENEALYITLYDEQAQELDFLYGVEHGVRLTPERIPLGSGFTSHVVTKKKALHIRDYGREQESLPKPVMWGEEDKIYQSWVGVPMLIGERVIGTISVMADRPYAYSDEQETLLSTIADQVAVAIENARLFGETRKRADRLALVNRISKATSAVLQLDDLMELVYREIAPVFRVDTFFIALYDDAAESIDFRFMMDEGVRMTLEPQPLGSSLTSVVITGKKPLMIRNREEAERWQASMQRYGTMKLPASWLGVPLMIGERVIGVVNVQTYRPHAFGEQEELLLATIADQIAVAIENARLYEAISQELLERKRREGEIRKLSQYLESVIDNATVWLNVLDEEGSVVIWNKAAEAISGYSRGEVVGHARIWEWLYPDKAYRKGVVGVASEVISGQKAFTEDETIIRCKDGQTKTISWNDRGLLDESGNAIGSIAIGRDITAHKQAEEALRASEERFALAVAGSNAGIWDWDIQNDTLYWSPRMKELLGYASDEIEASFEVFEAHLHPEDKELTDAAIEAYLQERVPYDVEQRMRTKTGEYRWYRARGQALWDESGKPLRMVGSSADITELKQAEERLEKERNLLRTVIDLVPDTIYMKSADYRYTECNIAQARSVGRETPDAVVGRTDFDLYPAEMASEYRVNDETVVQTGKPLVNQRERGEDAEGKEAWFLTTKVPLRGKSGAIAGLVGISRDISDLQKAEAKIQHYLKEVEEANEEVKQFAYIVSHDLRAPLVNLKGFAAELRLALEDLSPVIEAVLPTVPEKRRRDIDAAFREDIPEALGFIESSVTRMDNFINAVLKLSRLGRRELSLKSVDMNALVEAARQSLAHQIEERHVALTVTDLPEIVADQTSMEQVIGNLFSNAVHYLDPDRQGVIEIGGKREDLSTTFWVRDNGRGISEDDAPKVFAPFRRAGKQDVPGEGMGLSYVKTMVRMHGGQIWFESKLGVGTTFFFTIANDLAKGEVDGGQTRGQYPHRGR